MSEKLTVVVGVDDKAKKPLKGISGAFAGLKSKIGALLSPANLLAAGIAVIGATFVKLIGTLAKIETKMVNVGNLYGASRKEVNKLTNELIELGQTVPQSVENLADALFDVVSAGVPAAESIEFLGVAAKLATAGVTDTKTAVFGLTSVMNAYGFAADDAMMISDKFFAAQQKGMTTIEKLSNAVGNAAPLASALGISFDELITTMSAITLSGIKTSVATNGLRAALSNLLKPSEQAAQVAKAIGIEFDATAIKTEKGFINLLKKVIKETGGSKDALGKLFGSIEAVNVVLALSNNNFKTFKDVQEGTTDATGKTTEALKENINTLSAQWKLIKNNALAIGKLLFGWVIPAITATFKAFNKFFKFLSDGLGNRKRELKTFASFFKKLLGKEVKTVEETEKKKNDAIEKADAEKLKQAQETKAKEIDLLLKKLDEKKDANADSDAWERDQWDKHSLAFEAYQLELRQHGKNTLEAQIAYLEENAEAEKLAGKNSIKLANEIALLKIKINEKLAQSMLDSAAIAADGESDLLKATTKAFKSELKKQVASVIAARQAELAAFAAANWWNPAGWASFAALVGLEIIKNEAFAAIDRFEGGGVVGGTSMVGDKKLARVNSGELILNQSQQRNLSNQLFGAANNNSGGGSNGDLVEEIRALRSDLNKPKEIRLDGNSFSKATYQNQKRMLRTGEISTKG